MKIDINPQRKCAACSTVESRSAVHALRTMQESHVSRRTFLKTAAGTCGAPLAGITLEKSRASEPARQINSGDFTKMSIGSRRSHSETKSVAGGTDKSLPRAHRAAQS
jgi:hypothetical protein